ncbi:hypothetical protein GCM10008938_18910 [Deinococcus roseus]|uniref:Uncharacterized protein n=2 Tax=Deinococcus roseus TaxID=392414 RepID=A0ABQ2D0N9_9DEIO|nr:hypothetical protein GCM10008938_18910 [Deinococcus roseus]
MKIHLLLWTLCLTACVPQVDLNTHEGCRVPAVFDEQALDWSDGKPVSAGIKDGFYVYLLLPALNPDGTRPVIITNGHPGRFGYVLQSQGSQETPVWKYVHPKTGGIWMFLSDAEGTKLAHNCM